MNLSMIRILNPLRILDNIKVIHDLSVKLKLEMDVVEQALDRLHLNGIHFRVI